METNNLTLSLEQIPTIINIIHDQLQACKTLILSGEMGAGKTTLLMGLLTKMGIEDPQGSPTYSLINEYKNSNGDLIYHVDAFRIKNDNEAFDLGLDELFSKNAYFFVEWPEKIIKFLPERCIQLNIEHTSNTLRTYSLRNDYRS